MDPDTGGRRKVQLSPDAYWLRRVAALVGLLVAVGVVAWAASGFGGETQRANPVGSKSSAAGVSAPRPTVTVTVTVTPQPAGVCSNNQIEVKLLADQETYPAGADPNFTIYVVNTSDVSCKRDVGSKALSLRVLSEGGLVWDSAHCTTFADAGTPASDLRQLQPGEEYTTTVTWDRTASAPGCAGGSTEVGPGTYQLVGAAGSATSEDLTFFLE